METAFCIPRGYHLVETICSNLEAGKYLQLNFELVIVIFIAKSHFRDNQEL